MKSSDNGDEGSRTDYAPKGQWSDHESDGAGCFITIFIATLTILAILAWSFWSYLL